MGIDDENYLYSFDHDITMKEITILYVDDEEINLFLFESSFSSDYRVYTAISPSQGLEKLKGKEGIIVVISDMRMPEMNGIEFIKRARQLHPEIAYFILTGFSFNEEIEDALSNEVIHEFFTKPFDKKKIKHAIEEATGRLNLI